MAGEGRQPEEVSIRFVDTKTISEIHKEFFDDPSITDCMSFPIDDQVLGDVVVCPKVAIDYGGDPYEETTLYIVHGLLHLMGYNDIEELDRQEMRMAEKRHLDTLKKKELMLTP